MNVTEALDETVLLASAEETGAEMLEMNSALLEANMIPKIAGQYTSRFDSSDWGEKHGCLLNPNVFESQLRFMDPVTALTPAAPVSPEPRPVVQTVPSGEVKFRNVMIRGSFYNPASKHYGVPNLEVNCDSCGIIADMVIGYGKQDLCLDCAATFSRKMDALRA